jgi:hypothetical protein
VGTDATAAALLAANIHVGDCHYLAQGLEAMREALTPPLSDSADDLRTPMPNDGNLGFVRPTARLAVVVLADEDDKSGFDPDGYQQLLEALKGQGMGYRVSLSAIVPTDPTCATAGPPGTRYTSVATGTGGQSLSICSGSYSSVLSALLTRAATPQRDFHLSALPDLIVGLVVTVNDAPVSNSTWTYDPVLNAVVFVPASTPSPGSWIRVQYKARCP